MSRFLMAAWPYVGHVTPTIALARRLRDRGHEVAVFTGAMPDDPAAREGLHRFGFQALARALGGLVGRDGSDTADLHAAITHRDTAIGLRNPFARLRRIRSLYDEVIVGTIPAQVSDLQNILAAWSPDVIVADPFLWAPYAVLREKNRATCAVFSFYAGCLVPGPGAPPAGLGLPSPRVDRFPLRRALAGVASRRFGAAVRQRVNDVRRQFGLQPLSIPMTELLGRMPLHLVCSSPEFDYARTDLPASVHYVGPLAWDRGTSEPLPDWAGAPRRAPLVYVSEGTAQVRTPFLLQAACGAARDLPVDFLMTTGRHRAPSSLSLGTIPSNVHLEPFVALNRLAASLALVVTNGGSNTVRDALAAGVPMVVVPMEWDQHENAQRVVEAGAGVRMSIRRCTPRRLRNAIQHVLSRPAYGEAARGIARSFARYGNGARAVELLEQLAASTGGRAADREAAAV
jgi:UDP:flavonoid glycosyltransferase YjiC (YdhE family)